MNVENLTKASGDAVDCPDEGQDYYCLASDGQLYLLGNHGDFWAADDTAESIGLEVVWLFGEESAGQWRETLSRHLDAAAGPQRLELADDVQGRALRALAESREAAKAGSLDDANRIMLKALYEIHSAACAAMTSGDSQ